MDYETTVPPIEQARLIQFRWVEVVPVPPIQKPPIPLWNIRLRRPKMLSGGRTWLDGTDYAQLDVALECAVRVDESFQRFHEAHEKARGLEQQFYRDAMAAASTSLPGVIREFQRDDLRLT